MSEIWDDELRKAQDSGDVYAYGFGVAHGMIQNAALGRYDLNTLVSRFAALRDDVQRRVDELHEVAQARLEKEQNGAPRPVTHLFPTAAPTPIFESENDGDQTGE